MKNRPEGQWQDVQVAAGNGLLDRRAFLRGGAAFAGNPPLTSGDRDPAKTIANYWPFATTIFDFIRRTMPWQQPRSLTNEEVYALTAYILALNKLIGENDTMNAQTLPKVRMPNRDRFIVHYPDRI